MKKTNEASATETPAEKPKRKGRKRGWPKGKKRGRKMGKKNFFNALQSAGRKLELNESTRLYAGKKTATLVMDKFDGKGNFLVAESLQIPNKQLQKLIR